MVEELLKDSTVEKALDRLYVRCLSRYPTEAERAELLAAINASPSPKEGLEDVFWAILNSREFVFNH